jgi:hypothetical protein
MLEQKIAGFRLRRHHLSGGTRGDAVAICRDICGVQAQLMPAARLQIRARNPKIARADIEAALWQSRTLVRALAMRQTVHLIPSDEFPIYIAALQSSRVPPVLRIMARFGIEVEEADALTAAILETLAAGPMTKAAVEAAVRPQVSQRVRAWMDKVWNVLRLPLVQGLVCYGSGEGNEVRFVRTDHWLAKFQPVAEGEAQALLLRKYLGAYGPATPQDFAHWSGMPVKQCALTFKELQEELVPVDEWGMILEPDRKVLNAATIRNTSVKLLPAFDPLLLAHSKKHHLIEDRYYKRVYRSLGWISPVILVGGRIVGTWSHKMIAGKMVVETEPFGKLPREVRVEIDRQATAVIQTR